MRIDKNSRGTLALVFGFSALVSAALIIFGADAVVLYMAARVFPYSEKGAQGFGYDSDVSSGRQGGDH